MGDRDGKLTDNKDINKEKEVVEIKEQLMTPLPPREIVKKLWDIAKKYELAIKSSEIFPIEETEQDRNIVNTLFSRYADLRTKILDARIVLNFVTMQRLRDIHVISKYLDKSEILRYIAYQVKRRGSPVISFPAYGFYKHTKLSKSSQIISTEINESDISEFKEKISELLSEDLTLSDDEVLENQNFENLRNSVLLKLEHLLNRPIAIEKLKQILTPLELNVLSQILRDNLLFAYKIGRKIIFSKQKISKLERGNTFYETVVLEGEKHDV
ncbi:MAG: hypothetical protein ACP6IS_02905 [Candidatus Asgardarchaeia archaeon]